MDEKKAKLEAIDDQDAPARRHENHIYALVEGSQYRDGGNTLGDDLKGFKKFDINFQSQIKKKGSLKIQIQKIQNALIDANIPSDNAEGAARMIVDFDHVDRTVKLSDFDADDNVKAEQQVLFQFVPL